MRVSTVIVFIAITAVVSSSLADELTFPEPERITNVMNSYPCASPDGSRIVFQSNRTGRWELYVMNRDGTEIRQLTDRPGDNVTPSWSPDGATIVFAATIDDNSDIYAIPAEGGRIRRLTEHPGDDSHPHWSSDGKRIMFNSPRTTPDLSVGWMEQWHEVFSMNADGGEKRQHTNHKTVCTFASYSPDGTKMVYRKITNTSGFSWDLSNRPRNSEVFIADIDGSNEVNLSNSAAFDGWPVFSPDGKRVAFSSNRAGPANVGQLYIVDIDGADLGQVTSGPWSYAQPSWEPGGRSILAYQLQETASYEFGDVTRVTVP